MIDVYNTSINYKKQYLKKEMTMPPKEINHGWAMQEFSSINLGDKRLDERLIKICDRFSESPESPINQACSDWAETKAAYRFFKNDNIKTEEILKSHISKTVKRAKNHSTILAIQDTSFLTYGNHQKTQGLGTMFLKRENGKTITTDGLMMHTSLAVNSEGLPIGILNQTIKVRHANPGNKSRQERKYIVRETPIEDKESYKWLESLRATKNYFGETKVITVCDREADIYEFFQLSYDINAPVLVRAKFDRIINKKSRYQKKYFIRLWKFMNEKPLCGTFEIEIPARNGVAARKATLELKFGSFMLNASADHLKYEETQLPDLKMNAIYLVEKNPPANLKPLEWMLLTNTSVTSYDEALEKVQWYCLRWRIEMFHKVLKSGFKVESCRLSTADRLMRYLTVMSIIAWRIFMITLISRTNPDLPCSIFLSKDEWKVLYLKIKKKNTIPKQIPTIRKVVRWVAQLGGFLARKGDGEPGTLVLWRGWKRLSDLTEGWNLASNFATCG